ncbi:MAG: ESPR-type extended signal peptide-containing protein [Pasteurellaceae bacterium]|nr:ESPR-type extended signal peptide-containing protein [Pasteurellaceae bacterium]
MNKIFKVIWNPVTQSFIMVYKLSKTKGKSYSSTDKRKTLGTAVAN